MYQWLMHENWDTNITNIKREIQSSSIYTNKERNEFIKLVDILHPDLLRVHPVVEFKSGISTFIISTIRNREQMSNTDNLILHC